MKTVTSLFILAFSILITLCPAISFSQEQTSCIIVVGPTPEKLLTETHLAVAEEIAGRLAGRGISCEVRFIEAWKRANLMFQEGEIDVLFAEIIGDKEAGGITGMPVGFIEGFSVFTLADAPVINKPQELKGKTVGLIRGRFYPPELMQNTEIKKEEVDNLENNFRKLLAGRIDATVEYREDALRTIRRMNIENSFRYGDEFFESYLAFRFHDTQKGIFLMEEFNIITAQIVSDGTYAEIFSKIPHRMLYSCMN